jgi:hypothetical protein
MVSAKATVGEVAPHRHVRRASAPMAIVRKTSVRKTPVRQVSAWTTPVERASALTTTAVASAATEPRPRSWQTGGLRPTSVLRVAQSAHRTRVSAHVRNAECNARWTDETSVLSPPVRSVAARVPSVKSFGSESGAARFTLPWQAQVATCHAGVPERELRRLQRNDSAGPCGDFGLRASETR